MTKLRNDYYRTRRKEREILIFTENIAFKLMYDAL